MAYRPGVKRHTITDIVASVYCEQKTVFDRERGRVESSDMRAKREHGIEQHKKFDRNARRGSKSPCFIATAVYGTDAPETEFLRAWRDKALMPSGLGRALVWLYYRVSPLLVPMLLRHARLASLTRSVLSRVVRFLRGG